MSFRIMSSNLEKYLQARFDYEEIKKAIDQIAEDILLVGTALKRDPARFSFGDAGVELPKEAFNGQSYPALDWPTPALVQEQLRQLHENRLILRKTWSQIPTNLKSGLQPPPTGVLPPQSFGSKQEK